MRLNTSYLYLKKHAFLLKLFLTVIISILMIFILEKGG